LKTADEQNRVQDILQRHRFLLLQAFMPGMTHDLNNANNNAIMSLESLSEIWKTVGPILDRLNEERSGLKIGCLPYDELRAEIPRMFTGVREGLTSIRRVTAELRTYVSPQSEQPPGFLDFNQVVESVTGLLAGFIRRYTNQFHLCYGESLPFVQGDVSVLMQLVIHMVQSVCRAIPNRNTPLEASTARGEGPETVILCISVGKSDTRPQTAWRIVEPVDLAGNNAPVCYSDYSVPAWMLNRLGGRIELPVCPEETAARMILPAVPM